MKKSGVVLCLVCWVFSVLPAFSQTRSFKDLFPTLSAEQRAAAFSEDGLVVSAKTSVLRFAPTAPRLDITGPLLQRKPSYITESILLIPYGNKTISLLTVYNALSNIRGLKGRLYHSATRNENVPLFEDATRIESAKKTNAIPDPPAAASVPAIEIIYIRLKDANFGNSYYRADISANQSAILCTLSNFKSLTYMLIPLIKEDKFIAQLYFEPVTEGILIYSAAGADVSDFIAKQTDMGSAVRKRLEVINQWVIDGVKNQKS